MILKRRQQPTILQRLRTWIWPRRSWSRSLRYFLLRLERLKATPHQIALGCAAGVFASIIPLLGAQMVLAAVFALIVRANIPASLIGTFFGNPISWPLIWTATYATGCQMLGIDGVLGTGSLSSYFAPLLTAIETWSPKLIDTAVVALWPVLKPMLAGSLPLGLAAAVVIYYTLRPAVAAYQNVRPGATMSAATPLGGLAS